MNSKSIFGLLKQTASEWIEDKAPMLGAAIAYYTVFSLAPLLILGISLAGLFLGPEAARGEIFAQLQGLLGTQTAEAMQDIVKNASEKESTGIIGSIIGIVTLLFGASGVFGQLQAALNTVWEVEPKPGQGIMGFIRTRFLSFGFIIVIGFLLLVSMMLTVVLSSLIEYIPGLSNSDEWLATIANIGISFAVITLLFALIFKFLPDAKVAWHDVWIGALITALLFSIGKYLLGIYIGAGSVGSSYGAAGSLIVLLVWVYYSAQIVLFGAEFTQVYANRFGDHVAPSEHAIAVDTVKKVVAEGEKGGPDKKPMAKGEDSDQPT
ncbi:MAG: YihY/virulence factor BrkB family protein [Chthoniobacterales bacterium]